MNAILTALVNGFLLSVPIAALVWLVLRVSLRVVNAATRYGIWWMVLLISVALPTLFLRSKFAPTKPSLKPTEVHATVQENEALPVSHLVSPDRAPHGDAGSASANAVGDAPVTQPVRDLHVSSQQPVPQTGPQSVAAKSSSIPSLPIAVRLPSGAWPTRIIGLLAGLWALASLLLFTRLAVSFAILWSRKNVAEEAPSGLQTSMQRSLVACGVLRQVRIGVVKAGDSPIVAGPLRPCVLIPTRLLSALNDSEIEQVCLHEAAHLARYDDWSLLLQRTVEAVSVFHPVLRWIARQIDLEREIACDDFVISATGQPRPYASCLTHVAELAAGRSDSPLAAAVVDESSHLTLRISTLLDKTRRTGTSILRIQLTAAVLALCLLTWLAAKSPALFALATPQPASQSIVANILDGHISYNLQPYYPTATERLIQIPPSSQRGLNVSVKAADDSDAHSALSRATVQQPVPDWETKAGGRAKFAIASVTEDNPPLNQQPAHSNMGRLYDANDDSTPPAGGLFSVTNVPLFDYISFAYKLSGYEGFFLRHAIAQVSEHRYDVHAGAHGNPTKDQFRLMVQALLADRFKLAVHWETRQLPWDALVLSKPGTLGPRLKPHSDDASCSVAPEQPNPVERDPDAAPPTVAGGFPRVCGSVQHWQESGRFYVGGRNVNMEQIANGLPFGLPGLDKTGLTGKYDFVVEYASRLDPQPEDLEEQLGLKLERTTEPTTVLVVDHIEEVPQQANAQAAQFQFTSLDHHKWEAAAGGKQTFDAISVKPSKPGDPPHINFPLGIGDTYPPSGGLFADMGMGLYDYITFAYKLTGSQNQLMLHQFTELPTWIATDRFDIHAQSQSNPTKDQMRLMMQSLLADRFKLVAHYETRQLPAYAVVLAKPGKTGPQLQPHSDDVPCVPSSEGTPPSFANGLPDLCGGIFRAQPESVQASLGHVHSGGRRVTMSLILAALIGAVPYGGDNGVDRPVIDKTGLTGTFDFSFEFVPGPNNPPPPGAAFRSAPSGPSFVKALEEQLGLKLVPKISPVEVFVIDHIEKPSSN